ncbi:hypothetical protein GCM10007079_34240 [Nocardiopsis terrae]|uniref:DUF4282 domain-containing protein n=1 Tax=Nocardiopsis terrae TaxID=372655 RepID=A0ABR9HJQ0_9ACTN|nr:DUF4282 domain-containing protein [Nocardiopsis terrae]MBE1459237.1 hypothetical protein [Nocardiopsis terrae]GHC88894.1 hypothetical protein GCM10007079_34240 [Nocardiopsis terrae]
MSNPPEYPQDPSQQPYGQQPQQPYQQPQSGGYPGAASGGQYYQQPGVPPQQPQGGYAQPASTGFFGALFDFSFREFVTTRIIKILFILWLVLIGFWFIGGLVAAIAMMSEAFFAGFLALLGVLVGTAISVLLSRVVLELLIVVFRISEDLTAIRQRGGM